MQQNSGYRYKLTDKQKNLNLITKLFESIMHNHIPCIKSTTTYERTEAKMLGVCTVQLTKPCGICTDRTEHFGSPQTSTTSKQTEEETVSFRRNEVWSVSFWFLSFKESKKKN